MATSSVAGDPVAGSCAGTTEGATEAGTIDTGRTWAGSVGGTIEARGTLDDELALGGTLDDELALGGTLDDELGTTVPGTLHNDELELPVWTCRAARYATNVQRAGDLAAQVTK